VPTSPIEIRPLHGHDDRLSSASARGEHPLHLGNGDRFGVSLTDPCPTERTVESGAVLHDDSVMSTEQVAQLAECIECGDVWLPVDDERWRAYVDNESGLVFYCATCAAREFGDTCTT
jgi:hypothetical protein